MAPKGKRQTAGAGKKKKEDPNKLNSVPLWKMVGKASMRSWADENGNAMLSEGDPPHRFFTLEKVREITNEEAAQLVKMPAAGFQNAISNLVAGQEVLVCVPPEKPSSDDDFAKMKLAEARKILCDKDVLKAVELVHLPFEKFEDKRTAEKATKTILEHFGDKDEAAERLEILGRLADEGARLYSAAMAAMQLIALATSVKEWAKKIPEIEKQPASIRKFTKSQKKEDLFAALANGIAAAAEKTFRKKRYGFGEDPESAEKSTSGSSSSGSDSDGDSSSGSKSGDKKKKKSKKREKSTSRKRGRSKSKSKKDKKKRGKSDESEKSKGKKRRRRSSSGRDKKEKKRGRSSRGRSQSPKGRGGLASKDEDLFAEETAEQHELAPAEESWSKWDEADIQSLRSHLIHCDGKPDLADLQRIATLLPEDVADAAGLAPSCKAVLALKRMARKPTVEAFLSKVQKLVGDALAWKDAAKFAAESDEEGDEKSDIKKEKGGAGEAPRAAEQPAAAAKAPEGAPAVAAASAAAPTPVAKSAAAKPPPPAAKTAAAPDQKA